jgi:Flp pilus assembly protein TadB
MKRCWRSWPRTTSKLSPLSSLWPTNVPRPLRATRGTRRHRPGPPRRVLRMPSLRTAKRRRKRTAAMRSRAPPLWSLQLRLGAGATAINTHNHIRVTTAHALCTPMVATAPHSVARSSTSRNASTRDASSLPGMAPHLVADLARKGSTTIRWPWLNRTSGISHQKGS